MQKSVKFSESVENLDQFKKLEPDENEIPGDEEEELIALKPA